MRTSAVLLCVSGLLLTSRTVAAEPSFGEAPHRLYLRSTAGLGVLTAKTDREATPIGDGSQDGPSFAADLLVGVESSRVACGGALLFETQLLRSPAAADQAIPGRLVTTALLGPFLDAYPRGGWGVHLGGATGLSWARFGSNGPAMSATEMLGVGAAVWAGQDISVSPRWAVGPLIRLMAERSRDPRDSGNWPWAESLTLSLTATYH